MKVLIVCSYRAYAPDGIAPFVKEQVDGLCAQGIELKYHIVRNKGVFGYMREVIYLRKTIQTYRPDIVHAHYGLCGLLSCLSSKSLWGGSFPVITTYHGSDINEPKSYRFSRWAVRWSAYNIFVSRKIYEKAGTKENAAIIPCAVDTTVFYPQDRDNCRARFGFEQKNYYVLFSKAFYVPVKNYPLAKSSIDIVNNHRPTQLIELDGYSREEVAMLMNACDCALMTSFSEGSPQFVKEALACGCPVVSTDVGDVADVISGMKGCYITSYDAEDVAGKVELAMASPRQQLTTIRRERVTQEFSNQSVTSRLLQVYQQILDVK